MLKFNLNFNNTQSDKTLISPTDDAIKSVFDLLIEERETHKSGYYDLPFLDDGLKECKKFMKDNKEFLQNIHNIVVIGIGGSSLGVKAIDLLLAHLPERNKRNLKCLEHTDPIKITNSLRKITLKDTLFILISKSGTTIETTSLLKYVLKRYEILHNTESKRHLVAITDFSSPLQKWCEDEKLKYINIEKNIGGRFSVLSSVGLLPLGLLGYDIDALLKGARDFSERFFARKEDHLLKKAIFMAKSRDKYHINILFSYSSSFKHFNAWYVQLWGESLGKIDKFGKKVGLTPISLIGSIDQHSFLQLIIQGVGDKTVTFISLKENDSEPKIPDIKLRHLESTNFVNHTSFSKLLNMQQIATMESLNAENIPTDHIQISVLNEKSVGELISYFELLTSSVGVIFGIDTYNQPGVEFGKARLKEMFKGTK